MRRLREIDIETIAGVIAAITALVLHLLHIADEGLLLAIILVILALILIRDLRREAREEKQAAALDRTVGQIGDIHATLQPPDTLLIGPAGLRDESTRFGERAHGEMVWFNVCLAMFEPQSLSIDCCAPPSRTHAYPRSSSYLMRLNGLAGGTPSCQRWPSAPVRTRWQNRYGEPCESRCR